MAEYELIQDRLISGTGVLRVPSDKQDNRHSVLYLDVVRQPRNRYLNRNWNPSRGKYAYITYLRSQYVIGTADMEFEKYALDSVADITGQNLIALKCIYNEIAGAIAAFSLLQGTPVGLNLNLIKGYESLDLLWDEIRIKCYADTAIQARLYRLKYDSCDSDYDRRRRPPPPPPSLPPVPPGTNIEVSPPYDDDPITDPYEGDEIPAPEPETSPCVGYNVNVRIFGNWADPDGTEGGFPYVDRNRDVWGEVFGLDFRKQIGAYVAIVCQGVRENPCGERQNVVIVSGEPGATTYPDPIILNITPIA